MTDWNELFDGKTLSGWRPDDDTPDHDWKVAGAVDLDPDDPERFEVNPGTGVLVNNGRTKNLLTEHLHRDGELHVEFTVPENSGVYLMGKYEIQVLDSWGEDDLRYGTCGGIYARYVGGETVGGTPPRTNASRPLGEWQSYDVAFRAPRFDGEGDKTENAVFERVEWNGELVHEEVEVTGPTRASIPGPERPRGPLMLQGDHGPVAYRNLHVREV
jgi:hypothetical protein